MTRRPGRSSQRRGKHNGQRRQQRLWRDAAKQILKLLFLVITDRAENLIDGFGQHGAERVDRLVSLFGQIGGLADLGYLLFVDLPGYVNFFPGAVMTFVSGSAIVLSFWVWLTSRRASAEQAT